MSKILKTISFLPLLAGFAGFLALGYYSQPPEEEVSAQEFGALTCNGPIIPNGQVAEDVVELMNVVFKEYQLASGNLRTIINQGQGLLAAVSQTEDVCDFSKCQPQMVNNRPGEVSNIAPNFFLQLNAYAIKGQVGIRPGLCSESECAGDPCAIGDIRSNIEAMANLVTSFSASYNNIHDTFSAKSQAVTEDTRIKANDYKNRQEEPIGAPITKQEEIKRKIEAVEGLIELCSLSELERQMVKAGKLGEKKLKKCIDALKDGAYEHPIPWSEACSQECSGGDTQRCVECLGSCQGTSILARLNCRIYSVKTGADAPKNCGNGKDPACCGNVCKDNFDSPLCNECLCKGLTTEECNAWICGGHLHNWICCSAAPLK